MGDLIEGAGQDALEAYGALLGVVVGRVGVWGLAGLAWVGLWVLAVYHGQTRSPRVWGVAGLVLVVALIGAART
ncbi:hypothetical protein [Streptomyces sp. CBG9]|uniref:hypothetical protein n=1 Tax=Streptomyces sp. CBG9 TaxID=2762622 RepID=UPI0016466EF9|nr:hypothetical protein [Streptomyces sp. CBG9]